MDGNDASPCCCISSRAKHQRRIEWAQGDPIDISTSDVLAEWNTENNGDGGGLVMLQSIDLWRTRGWNVGGHLRKIDAYATIDTGNTDRLRSALYLLGGLQGGFALPCAVTRNLASREVWDFTGSRELDAPDENGGHAMFVCGIDPTIDPAAGGLVRMKTWHRDQYATLRWFQRYCEECYGIVPSVDAWLTRPGLDPAAMRDWLRQIGRLQ
jgi:hypothetical protein